MNVAIIGTGNIGTDLLVKATRSTALDCVLFAGRNLESPGAVFARKLGANVSDRSIDAVVDMADDIDVIFDATNAETHVRNFATPALRDKLWIDMTPSRLGVPYVPAIGRLSGRATTNFSCITCGAQASLPIIHAVAQVTTDLRYIEIVSSIAARSAGVGTRENIDEYISATEGAALTVSRAQEVKAILIVNPAIPEIDMSTSISFLAPAFDLDRIQRAVTEMAARVRAYVPGYKVVTDPVLDRGRLVVRVTAQGLGDYLPKYAGNLDIITCAGIAIAEAQAVPVERAV